MSEVNHPPHYNTGKIEVIEFIEDKKLGFHLGNAVKYIARAGKKDPSKTIQDLEKAIWYINRQIETLKPEPRRPNDMNPRTDYPVPENGIDLRLPKTSIDIPGLVNKLQNETCPRCGSPEFFIARDMTSRRTCAAMTCGVTWECPK